MSAGITAEALVGNARRLAKDAFHLSVALEMVAAVPGRTWTAICCSCLDRVELDIADDLVHRLATASWMSFPGGCMLCPYFGCDTLVAALRLPATECVEIAEAA